MTAGTRSLAGASALALALAGGVALCSVAAQAQMKHEGVTATVMTFTGPQIAEPLQRRAPDFEKLTGAKINVITVPFSDLYNKLLTDLATGTNSYDALVFAPQWMVDFIEPGYLEDLTDRVKADTAPKWDDIAPFFRDFSATYNGKVYTIPLDGDFQMVYYRTDLLKKAGLQPPKTWDDYLAIAKTFNGKDLNGDGKADYGSCIAKKRNAQSYWLITSVAGDFLQTQGTTQGVFFDTDDMKPLVNNEASARRSTDLQRDHQVRPAGRDQPRRRRHPRPVHHRPLRALARLGRHRHAGDRPDDLQGQDKVGAVIIPGSKQVLDRATGKLVDCDATTCPYAIDGVNHAPFAAFGGWSGAVNAAKDAEGQGRGLRLPLLHEPARAVQRRRHHRQDRLQPLPHLAVREPRSVDQGRDERGRPPRSIWAPSRTA